MTTDIPNNRSEFDRAVARVEWLLIVVAAVFLAFGTFTSAITDNDRSRLASVQSLVEQGTWIIDDSRFHQEPGKDYQIIDKVWINEHFYSSKPPVLSFLMAGAYWPLHHVFGYDFDREQDRRFLIWFLTFAFTGVPFLWIAVLFRIAARWFVEDPITRLVGLFIILFCNEHLGFAQTINNHVPAASLLFTSMILAIGIVHGKISASPIGFIVTGLAAGLLPTTDLPGSFFCILLWIYLVRAFPSRTLLWFTLGAVPSLALHFGITYLLHDHWKPFYMVKEYYDWPGSYWEGPKLDMDAAGEYESKIAYFFHLSVGRKGLFSLYPVLLLSIGHLVVVLSRSRFNVQRVTFLVSLVVFPVYAWVAWTYQRDDRLPYFETLVYFMIFALAPVTIVWLITRAYTQPDVANASLPKETIAMGVLTFVWMIFYTFKSDNYGGSATGFRWFMFFTPALQFFGIFALDRMKSGWRWALVCVLVGISFYSGYQAEVHPWSMNWDWPVRFLGKWITR